MAKLIKDQEQNVVNGEFRRADAWLNVSAVSKDGSRTKQLGGIPVNANTDLGKWLLNRENGIEGLNLVVDLNIVGNANKPESLEEMFG